MAGVPQVGQMTNETAVALRLPLLTTRMRGAEAGSADVAKKPSSRSESLKAERPPPLGPHAVDDTLAYRRGISQQWLANVCCDAEALSGGGDES
ncbi:hypothetical protein E4U55_001104 [Claviceps digitariae]|nr:hypothetical protein E4U55_001104 [Claviceps digitariae]